MATKNSNNCAQVLVGAIVGGIFRPAKGKRKMSRRSSRAPPAKKVDVAPALRTGLASMVSEYRKTVADMLDMPKSTAEVRHCLEL